MATVVSVPASTDQISYADLYARWERANWRATELDFGQDRVDWHERLSPEQRRGALWLYTLFFHGEDSVADNLSPYIDAAPLEEQKYFLATQQVDEARHAVFFKRFMHEVVGAGDGSVGASLRETDAELTWGHRKVFGHLDEMADRLRRDRSRPTLAAAITLYHIVIEGSLAQPGQHMIDDALEREDLLPAFREGMRNVSLDEQRHIAFGVRLLADLLREDPDAITEAIVGEIRETIGWTTAVAMPPGWDRSYTEAWGYSIEDLYEEGARAQEQRLRAVGLPVDDLPRFPLPMELSPRERAERGVRMLKAGYLGPKLGPIRYEPAAARDLFDGIRRTADSAAVASRTTIQWEFPEPDAEPWHLVLDGTKQAAPGHVASPDLTLRLSWEDWVDLTAERVSPARLMLARRLRPKGDLRVLARLGRVFA